MARAVPGSPVPKPLEEEQLLEAADESHTFLKGNAPRLKLGKDVVNCLTNWT